jgi:hypothetical protein
MGLLLFDFFFFDFFFKIAASLDGDFLSLMEVHIHTHMAKTPHPNGRVRRIS